MNKKILLGILAVLLNTTSVYALEQKVDSSAQKKLTMTIYNMGRALVNDERDISFERGKNQISFLNISDQIIPSSVLVKSDGVRLLEQNFNFDLLTKHNILKKSVGEQVLVEYIDPATGAVQSNQAELLSYEDNKPILKIDNRIETNYPGRIILKNVPQNLSAQPTLSFNLDSNRTKRQNMQVSYLTEGLSWKADYVVDLRENNLLDLNGMITLTNHTAVSYKNVQLNLVAGEVNLAPTISPRNYNRLMTASDAVSVSASAAVESLGGYYLYSLPHKTNILSNQTKQVSLLGAKSILGVKTYEYETPLNNLYRSMEFVGKHPQMYLTFENKGKNNLGMALPEGTMRVYERDSRGRQIFVGEDLVSHTAKDQKVRIKLGSDFDISLSGRILNVRKIDAKLKEVSFEVKVNNPKEKSAEVIVYQRLPSSWKVLAENEKSQVKNAQQIFWPLTVPPETEKVLTYTVLLDER